MTSSATEFIGFENIRFKRAEGALHVEIASTSSDMNVVDGALHRELGSLFQQLKHETAANVVTIRGNSKAFSAGGDFAWMRQQNASTFSSLRAEGKQIVWNALDVEVPLVAVVEGPAIGLGATLALLCDVVIMSESATIADPHVNVGLVAGDGGAVLWPLLVGPMLAKKYLLTGASLSGREAADMGLITECVPDEQLEEAVDRWVTRLSRGAPLAIRYTKLSVNQLLKQAMTTAFDYSTALEVMTFASADHAEALAAIGDKRRPNFTGA